MREIKFRAFDKVSRKMSPSFSLFGEFTMLGLVFGWLDNVRGNADGCCSIESLNDLIIIQYTGLKDVNGFEIYDGDIVELYPDDIEMRYIREVKWAYDRPVLGITNEHGGAILCKPNSEIIKVIGNIHENPELLEGEN